MQWEARKSSAVSLHSHPQGHTGLFNQNQSIIQFSLWSGLEISIALIQLTRPSGLWDGAHGPGPDFLCLWSNVNIWSLSTPCYTLIGSHPNSPAECSTFMAYPGPYHLAGCNMMLYLFLFFNVNQSSKFHPWLFSSSRLQEVRQEVSYGSNA